MRACHIQNGSGYETFFRVQTLAKTIWPPLFSSRRVNSVAVVVGGWRRTCAIDAGGRACIEIITSGNRGLWRNKRRSSLGCAGWMRGLHRRATPELFPSAFHPTAFQCEQIPFLPVLTFAISAILNHFFGLPNPNTSFHCDFWNSDQIPTTQM